MVRPISCFLKKPSYEDAARIVLNKRRFSSDVCRNPCNQNDIRVNYDFQETTNGRSVQLRWSVDDDRNIDQYQVLRAFGTEDFVVLSNIFVDGQRSLTFTDSTVLPGIEYRYSIALQSKLGDRCYSAIRKAKIASGKPITIFPNPSSGIIRLLLNDYSGPVQLSVTNSLGITVAVKELPARYGVLPSFDLSRLPKGYYWLKVQTKEHQTVQGFTLLY